MRTIIAGSRHIKDFRLLKKVAEDSGFNISEVISGGAPGVDKLGEDYAALTGADLTIFRANWAKNGRAAGPMRNERMAVYASSDKSKKGGLISLWDGKSRGSLSMLKIAVRYKLKIYLYRTDLDSVANPPTM